MSSKKEQAPRSVNHKRVAIGALLVVSVVLVLNLRSSNDPLEDTVPNRPSPLISEDIDQSQVAFSRVGLVAWDNCDAVLDYYKTNALKEVTAWGLGDQWDFEDVVEDTVSDSQSSAETSSYSTTNIQVEGVDEADIVKNDGSHIYLVRGQKLSIFEIAETSQDDRPVIAATVDLSFYATNMLVSYKPPNDDSLRDSLIIFGFEGHNQFRLAQVDIDDRQAPEVIADFTIDGSYVGARIVGNEVRLIMTSQPLGFEWQYPQGGGLRAQDVALEANKEIIKNSNLNNWVPAYQDNLQESLEINSLIDCSNLLTPYVFSGLDTSSIMTFNASKKLTSDSWQVVGLAADGQGIYANTDGVYVATTVWAGESELGDSTIELESTPDQKTVIHKFVIGQLAESESTTAAQPIYIASGEVSGVLLNQFSMDEYRGDLRVALTVTDSRRGAQENQIKILRPQRGILTEIGAVTGLGIDESIFAVRFMGPQAYIVTFRQIDPLYALDLSDPTNPQALGELKITGFSSYLHPVGDNLLLGVGQEANQEGAVEGLQISLFDTSDPTNPQRISQLLLADVLSDANNQELGEGWSGSVAERDHKAFLYYKDLAFIPYHFRGQIEGDDSGNDWVNDVGILILRVENNTLVVDNILKTTVSEPNDESGDSSALPVRELERTIVVNDFVYGIDYSGDLVVWRLLDGELLHFIPFY